MKQQPPRRIFREHALRQYMEQQEEDVLPQFVSPPVFIIVWLLCGLVVAAGVIAWMQRVPTYVGGSGVVSSNDQRVNNSQNSFDALVFIPVAQSQNLRNGLHALVQIGTSGQYVDSQVLGVVPQVYTPLEAQNQYKLGCNVAQSITMPTVAVRMRVFIPGNEHVQSGTALQARVQTGSQRVLSMFPYLNSLTGDS